MFLRFPRPATWPLAALLIAMIAAPLTGCAAATENEAAFLSARPLDRVSRAEAAPAATPALLSRQGRSGAGNSGRSQGAAGSKTVVYIDPGHGGVDTGAQATTSDGRQIDEKTYTLAVARRTATRLRADGLAVVLSRNDDSLPGSVPRDYTDDGKMLTADGVLADLQRRIDRANASGALVLLSIHFNAFSDPGVGGSETFYDDARSFASENERLGHLVQSDVITSLRRRGLDVADRGVTVDSSLVAEAFGTLGPNYNHLVLLGPAVPNRLRPSQMPGVLSEPLFISNPREADALTRADIQQALADAYATALEEFLRSAPQSATGG